MAKKLKEAGWEQDNCIHYWTTHSITEEDIVVHRSVAWVNADAHIDGDLNIGAPTCEEILRELPVRLDGESGTKPNTFLLIDKVGKTGWNVRYVNMTSGDRRQEIIADTLANAAAAMWIYLKENNLLPES